MPDFIVIGGQRCGSSSLYYSIKKHPCVASAMRKEIHYFDMNFDRHLNWYRAQFPTRWYKKWGRVVLRRRLVVGEATPYYICHPHAANRAFQTVPKAKIIAILRNPIDRAYSHYHRVKRKGWETLSFEEAIEKEEERLKGEVSRMRSDETYYSFNHHKFTYLTRGIYVNGLEQWGQYFPNDQILVLKSEDFFENPDRSLKQIFSHCGLPEWSLRRPVWKRKGKSDKAGMDLKTRKWLADYFAPHNQRLYDYLGKDFAWE